MDAPARRCDRCGYAVGVRRVMVMVDGRRLVEYRLCGDCLVFVAETIRPGVHAHA